MDWMQEWIDEILEDIPVNSYRGRVESELRDHLETQYRALTEAGRTMDEARAETLEAMGRPDRLRAEYEAAWLRTWPARLEALGYRLKAWAKGCALMFGAHYLFSSVISHVWMAGLSLPGDSQDPRIRLIRGAVENLSNSLFFSRFLPLALALLAGAYYLGRKFQASPRPAWQISVGLSFHWAFIAALMAWFRALDNHHRPFWEAVGRYFYYTAWYYALTLALCVLLGLVFGRRSSGRRPSAV